MNKFSSAKSTEVEVAGKIIETMDLLVRLKRSMARKMAVHELSLVVDLSNVQ